MSRLDWSRVNLGADLTRSIGGASYELRDGESFLPSRMPLAKFLHEFDAPVKRTFDRIHVIQRTGGTDANEFVHETAILILKHAERTSDASDTIKLIGAMPASYRRGLLVAWFGEFGPIGINLTALRVRMRKSDERRYRPFDIERAKLIPFYRLELRGRGKLVVPSG